MPLSHLRARRPVRKSIPTQIWSLCIAIRSLCWPRVARLTEVLRRPFEPPSFYRFDVGRGDNDRLLTTAGLMIAAADQERFLLLILHVHYPELVSDPAGTVAALYQHLPILLTRTPQRTPRRRVRRQIPLVGMGGAERDWRIMGSIPAGEHEPYARYMERFGIIPEQARIAS